MDLEKKKWDLSKKSGIFSPKCLRKKSEFENGSSHTAAMRSITYVASKKLKITFLEKSMGKKWVWSSEKKSESLKTVWESKKDGIPAKIGSEKIFLSFEDLSRVSFWFWIDLDRSRSSKHGYLSQNEGFWSKIDAKIC